MLKQEIDTPAVLVNLEQLEANIRGMQKRMNELGVNLRPHIKAHKVPEIARMQLDAGAVGITVAKLGEAEVFAENGVNDIFVAYEIVGARKLQRLLELARKVQISVGVDSIEVAQPLSEAFASAGMRCEVIIEVETGLGRCGVLPGEELLELAFQVDKLPGLKLEGIFTHEALHHLRSPEEVKKVAEGVGHVMVGAAEMLRKEGFEAEVVSVGATPARTYTCVKGVTENRPGTYVFNDRAQIGLGAATSDQCALTVLATVISRPALDRAIIDCGRKILTSDRDWFLEDFGEVVGRPDLVLERLQEEHGFIRLKEPGPDPKVGDLLEVVPNHTCVVMNQVDRVYVLKGDKVEGTWTVAARGKSR